MQRLRSLASSVGYRISRSATSFVLVALTFSPHAARAVPQCPPNCGHPRIDKAAKVNPDWAKLVLNVHGKKWSTIPPSCKSTDAITITVPDNTSLAILSLSTDDNCNTGTPSRTWNSEPGAQVGGRPAGARLEARPPNGSGPGKYVALVHWWQQPLLDANYNLCVWVEGKRSVLQNLKTEVRRQSENVTKWTRTDFPICRVLIGGNELGCEEKSAGCAFDVEGAPKNFVEKLADKLIKDSPFCHLSVPACKN